MPAMEAQTAEAKVLETLADPEWDFRTIESIVRDTQLDRNEVVRILENSPEVRQSLVPNRDGRPIFTLKSRPIKIREKAALIQRLLAKSF
jgi:hypothetical protein